MIWQGEADPTKLIGGNLQAGFYGECPSSLLITGDELARQIGLTAGTSQFSNESWLKFSYLGKVEYVAKKPFRYLIPWNSINAVNAVFGNRRINIKGKTYKVRLMKGKTEGKQGDQEYYYGSINYNSEWNRLMLPIHENAPSNWKNPENVVSPTENWNNGYKDSDLCTGSTDNGARSWCQEYGTRQSTRLVRGGKGVSYATMEETLENPIYLHRLQGWRPVLELVD
ncbi:hypothetical protein [Peptoniphilus catoniae]|uniref:hypothetical protein n=1 Tax=Peptoniphilus catoniae TaxID=1660341 RepID=UPI0010FE75BB|nr:hypothetical protein [Peptoniphilus catoniae]